MSNMDGTPTDQGGAQMQAGWYPDPTNGQLRWWDGQQWGPYQEQPMGMAPAPAPMGQTAANPTGTAAMAHYLGILGFIGPLIIMLMNNPPDPFVKDQSTEALNFHLTVLIGWFVVMAITFVTCGIGIFLAPVLWIGEIVFSVMGGQAASKGEWYRYPVNIRMVK